MRSTSSAWTPGDSCAAFSASFRPCCGSVARLASAFASSSRAWARCACVRAWLRCVSAKTATAAVSASAISDAVAIDEQAPVLALRLLALALEPPLAPPGEHRVGEHVVEDLVARPAAVLALHLAQDPLVPERLEHRPELVLVDGRVVGEIGRAVRDLRPRRRDEVVEDARRDVLLLGPEPGERAVEMLANDRLGPAELDQRLQPERVGAGLLARRPTGAPARAGGTAPRCARRRTSPSAWARPPSTSSSRPVATSSSTASTSSGSASTCSPVTCSKARSGPSTAARALSRSRWSSRSEFP